MAKRFHNKAYRRDIERRKYFSRLRKNSYWLWIDDKRPRMYISDRRPKSWIELIDGCKFAKKFKNGGNPEKRHYWEKKYKKQQAEKRKGYPEDKKLMDIEDIEVMSKSFECFCGVCDYFDTEECPYLGKVEVLTDWKEDIHCGKFFD